jgi:hypothetical protein
MGTLRSTIFGPAALQREAGAPPLDELSGHPGGSPGLDPRPVTVAGAAEESVQSLRFGASKRGHTGGPDREGHDRTDPVIVVPSVVKRSSLEWVTGFRSISGIPLIGIVKYQQRGIVGRSRSSSSSDAATRSNGIARDTRKGDR